MDFDTARLRSFLQVAERGTVAAAATALGYTAPAVSQQITKLEAQLGTALFDRVGGRLRLSPSGELLLPLARRMLDLTDEAEHAVDARPRHRHVVIAGFASAIGALVIPLLRGPHAARVTFEVREAEDDDALRDLGLGQVDLALVQEYDGVAVARSPRFAYTAVHHDRLRLLVPAPHTASVRLADLADQPWLVNGAGTRCEQATQAVLDAAGIRPRIAGHIADNRTLLALVAAGHGATIAPELVLADATADVVAGFTVARADLRAGRTILAATRLAEADRWSDLIGRMRVRKRRRR